MGIFNRGSAAPRPSSAGVGSILREDDTEDKYRLNEYGRWEFIPPISLKSKRIQTLFIPFTNQTGLIFGEGFWQNINAELHSSGSMIYQIRTSTTENETGNSAGYARVNDYAQVELLPKIQVIFTFSDTGTNSAAAIGMIDDTPSFITTTAGFIPNDVACITLGYRTSDTNLFVFHNDSTGAVTAVDTLIPRSTDVFKLEIEYETTTSVRLSLYDIDMALVYENTFTTEIPASGIDLAFIARIQNANNSVRYNINIFDYVRLEKTRPPLSATMDF
jgi:hypothetical protein